METKEALFHYAVRLGDNALILGHRLSEWTSFAPILEEDLALSNIALDYLGQASAFLKYAGEVEGKGRTEDDLAYKRQERKFTNALMCELKNGDFAYTITRQFLYSHFALLWFEALLSSKDETIAGIAAKSVKELRYHVRHSNEWMLRLGDGTAESNKRVQDALNDLWMFTGNLFEMNQVDDVLIKAGVAADLKSIKTTWSRNTAEIIAQATLKKPEDGFMQTGSLDGIHTENLGFILAEMQYLQRAYPDAKW